MNENYDNFKSYFTNEDEFNSWYEIVKDILNNEEFKKRVYFKHHEKQSLYTHSLLVSIFAYKYAKKHHADYKICAIAGLLHDFYTHAWQYSKDLDNLDKKYSENLKKKKKFSTLHAFIHPYEALINSNTYFNNLMNERVENAILVHMFPLSLFNKVKLPKYKESWIITYIDKAQQDKDFITSDGAKRIFLPNGGTMIDSSRYAWDRDEIVHKCIDLALKYKLLEDITGYRKSKEQTYDETLRKIK